MVFSALQVSLVTVGILLLAAGWWAWLRTAERRKGLEVALSEARSMLDAITATAQDAIIMADSDGRVVFWNGAAERMFGFTAAEVAGRNILSLIVPERYHESVVEGLVRFRDTGTGGAIGRMLRVEARRKDGTEFAIEHSLTGVRYRGVWHAVAILRDVSGRNQAETALAESERRFRAIADYTYDWEFWLGGSGRPRWVNSAVERMVGYSAEECMLMDDYPLAMVHAADKPLMVHHLQRARVEEFDNDVEFRVTCKSGTVKWAAASYQPIYDSDETYLGSRWSVRDISDRKAAEEELRGSEATKRAIVDSSLDCIITMDHEGRVVEFNPAAEATFGYERKKVVGKHLADLIIPPSLRSAHNDGLARYLKTGKGAALNQRLELTAMRADGDDFPVELTVTVVQTGERPLFTGFLRDLTGPKQAEEALRRNHDLVEAVSRLRSLYIGQKDPREVFETLLGDLLRLTGSHCGFIAEVRDDDGGGRERRVVALSCPVGVEACGVFDGLDEGAIDGRVPVIDNDPQGRPALTGFLGLPLWWGDAVVGSVGLANREGGYDETLPVYLDPLMAACAQIMDGFREREERLRAEAALAEQTEALERSNNELQQFAYVVSHDLQEPLRMVTSYMSLLQRRFGGALDGEAEEFIGFAVDGAERMRALIRDLLEYSRVGTRARPFVATSFDDVIDEALSNLLVRIDETGAAISRDAMPTLDADQSQMVRLFQNLIGNALKYAREDEPPAVHLSAENLDGGWVFSVRDNGIGIAPEHFNRIFGVFQRLHGRGEYEGTGIGLAICNRIVERHGGRIWVESEPGQGATFTFRLPEGLGGDGA